MGGVRRADGDPRAGSRLDVVHLNELKGGAGTTAHLLEFDSIHGRWHAKLETDGKSAIHIDGRRLGFTEAPNPRDVSWGDLG
ncbi:glyceraldehyde 3-phosphate dehydrogenase NAD-binding domain-containing protein, partial [Bacillus subtilis]|uniref:glyceraldehyde 3-phosphate dehydrogenase NAD-binding domain-containing protein n=1 Tax=Bacillus subtilis TaxID=1423 RepID=UPI003980CED9